MNPQVLQLSDPLFSWTHMLMICTLVVPFLLFWWDTRKQNRIMHDETQRLNMQMHRENQDRLLVIEQRLAPVWDWWLQQRGRLNV